MNDPHDHWLEQFRSRADSNPDFAVSSEWLDLRLLFRIGAADCWFKVYRGRIIDAMPYSVGSNRLGYDVVVSGPAAVWGRVIDRSSSFAREHAMGALQVDGDRTEGDRSYRAIVALADQVLPACGAPAQAS